MDIVLIASLSAASVAIFSFILSYDIEIKIKPKPQTSQPCNISNFTKCIGCGWYQGDNISLEKCNHKLCKVCLERSLKESCGTWVDNDRKVYKISTCPVCKELYREGGKKLY